jgi:hypothetical protein
MGRMGRRAITSEQLARLAARFREVQPTEPRDFAKAAQIAGVDRRTARRFWERGWPEVPSFRDQLAQERMAARARLQTAALAEQARTAPLRALDDAAQQVAHEVGFCRSALSTATGILDAIQSLKEAVNNMALRLAAEAGTISVEALPAAVRACTSASREAISLGEAAISLERRRVGDPSMVIGIKPLPPDRPLPELEAELRAAERAISRAKQNDVRDPETGSNGNN